MRRSLGFFQSPDFGEKVLVRKKEIYDGATPSGNSVMAYNLVRLSRILSQPDYGKKAHQTLRAFSQVLFSFPAAHTFSLIATDLLLTGGFELIAVGKREKALEDLLELQKRFLPEGVYAFKDEELESLSEFAKSLPPPEGEVSYYLCRDYRCEKPFGDISQVVESLSTLEGSPPR
ncbi:MAG: hypothetical protein Q9N34_06300 [Aquificota bacterium]|nr:hypothetical protein [Aquificota bacterium]